MTDRIREARDPDLRILSLGAGVQSTTMALLTAHGDITPMPAAAIFADTGWEPKAVYEHLAWLMSSNVLPFPVLRVSHGNLRDDILNKMIVGGRTARYASVPFFVPGGMGRRQCTKEYKIYPIRDGAKRLYYEKTGRDPRKRIPKGAIECLIGISTDEAVRMKPAYVQYMVNRWPLIDLGMSRRDCLAWLSAHDYPIPPKSSCLGCPYHSDRQWREIRDHDPEGWADTVAVDHALRGGMLLPQYMHRSCKPLDEVDLRTDEERGQLDLFGEECEGMCGV